LCTQNAKKKDLQRCFGTGNTNEVILEILRKGTVQESEKERKVDQDNMFKEIATVVLEKCLNSETRRPLTYGYVERMMKEIQYPIKPEEAAKKQGLQLIKALEKSDYPVERAPMQIQIRVVNDEAVVSSVKEAVTSVDKQTVQGANCLMECLIPPESYRELDKLVSKTLKGEIEVLQLSVMLAEDCALTDRHEEASVVSQFAPKFDPDGGDGRRPPAFANKPAEAEKKKEEGVTCNTAPGVVFPTREAMREHMKSDWHKFNLKRKTTKQDMLPFDQFQEAVIDADFF